MIDFGGAQQEIREDRRVVHIGGDRRLRRDRIVSEGRTVDIEAADADAADDIGVAVAAIDDVHSRD